MAKLKGKSSSNKIRKSVEVDTACVSKQCPWLSFQYMTRNHAHDLSSLLSGEEREKTLLGLYRKCVELTQHTWTELLMMPKSQGFETIQYGQLYFRAFPDSHLSKDTTVYVIRFDSHLGSDQGRIIGYKQSPCATFHVIGYDLNFTAYDHG